MSQSKEWMLYCVMFTALFMAVSLRSPITRSHYLTAAWVFLIPNLALALTVTLIIGVLMFTGHGFEPDPARADFQLLVLLTIIAPCCFSLSLFPSAPAGKKARWVVVPFLGLTALYNIWNLLKPLNGDGEPMYAVVAFLYLILWLRIDYLRRAVERAKRSP